MTLRARLAHLVAGGLLERRRLDGARLSYEYMLTERGRDFFICLMAAMDWGAKWCSAATDRQLDAIHLGCGERFEPVLVCSKCRDPIRAREVDVKIMGTRRIVAYSTLSRRQRRPGLNLLERKRPCPIGRALKVTGDRWSGLVIRECFLRTRRFDDFMRHLGIASNILSQRLTRLVYLGVLRKTRYQRHPPRYEYRLTDKGLALYVVPLALQTWGERWLEDERPALLLKHRLCGARVIAMLTCGNCHLPTQRHDVAFAEP